MKPKAEDFPNNTNDTENTENQVRRKALFSRIRSKLVAMAMAGLITLGGIKEGEANQVYFEKGPGAKLELALEPAITEEKLRAFEERLKLEEPEFLEWVARVEAKISEEID